MFDFLNQGMDIQGMIQQLAMQADPAPMLKMAQMSSLPGIANEFMPGLAGGVGMGGQANIPPDPNAQAPIPQKDPMQLTLGEIIYGDINKQEQKPPLPEKKGPAPLNPQQQAFLKPDRPPEPRFAPSAGVGSPGRAVQFTPIGLPNVPVGYQPPSLASLLYGRR
jgi:hypothetical protein